MRKMKILKNVFTSFRNAVIAFGVVILVLAIAGTCIAYAMGDGKEEIMDRKAALGYALADAGLKEADITITRQKLEEADGRNCYEIEFASAEYSYQYVIDAVTGDVTGVNIEALQTAETGAQAERRPGEEGKAPADSQGASELAQAGQQRQEQDEQTQSGQQGQGSDEQTQANQQGQEPSEQTQASQQGQGASEQTQAGLQGQGPDEQTQPGQQDQAEQIDMDTAKTIALADAGLNAADVTFTKQELDWDDGKAEYEVEFYTAEKEYEYEIDAFTGLIVDRSMEIIQKQVDAAAPGNTDSYIGEDRAKEIAAGDPGYAVTDVVFTKVELEQDDGRMEYEVEFYKDCMEYEYCIEACGGSILEHDCEHDDHCTRNHSWQSHQSHHSHHYR